MGIFSSKRYKIIKTLFFITLFFVTSVSKAQFPFAESFKNKTAPSVQFSGVALLTAGPIDPDGSGFLRLTSNANQIKGAVWSDVTSFPSYYGIDMSFEYYTYGNTTTNGADGIGFILYDAKTINPRIGPPGGNLGYTENTPKPNSDGFTTGYLGIGIDEFGNFSAIGPKSPGKKPNSITLRGSYLDGYPYLTSAQTATLTPGLTIAGGDRSATTFGSTGYRKIRITLDPAVSPNTGYYIDVYLTHGSTTDHIINHYNYTTPAPENLKFAFSSSTGNSNNYHEIRSLNFDVSATLLNPVANPDYFLDCSGLITQSLDITANDNGAVNISGTVNKASVDLDPSIPGIQFTKTVAEGTFTYDPATGKVTFAPIDNTIAGPVTIDYTFADTYGQTSNVSTITYSTVQTPIANTITAPAITTFCKIGVPANITGGNPSGGVANAYSYQWQSSTDDITFNDIIGANSIDYDPGSITTTTYYRRVVASGVCSTPSNVVTITIDNIASNTTSSTAICENATKALTATPTGGTWSIESGGGSISATAPYTYTPDNITEDTKVKIRYTAPVRSCGPTVSDVEFWVNAIAVPNAGLDQIGTETCGLTTVTLAGNTPTVGTTGKWTVVSGVGGSFALDTNSATIFTGRAGTTYTLRWTISNGSCVVSDDVIIKFNQNPTTANAGADQTGAATCGLTTVTLAGNTPTVGTGKWTIISGVGGSFASDTNRTTTFSGIAGMTYTLRWTISNGSCVVSDDVIIKFNQNPTTANAGADQTSAATCGLTTVTLAGNTPTVGTGKWTIVSGTGGSFTSATNPTTTFTGTSGMTYTLRWTITNAPCTSSDDVSVTFLMTPAVPTIASVTAECSATVAAPTTTDVCAGTITGTTSDDLTYSTQGTHTITWTFDDGNGNVSTATQNVIVKDSTKPVAPTLADVTGECSATATVATTTDACTGTITGTTSDALTYSTQGTHVITWTFDDKNGNVTTATQNVIVKDITKPVVPALADVTGECSAKATVATTTDACAGTITGTTSDDLTYSTQGTHVITWTFDDKNGNVTTATQNVIVKDNTKPVTPTLEDVTGECSATATVPTTTDDCSGTITGTTSDDLTYSTQGTHVITWTFDDKNGNVTTATQNVIVKDSTKPITPTLEDVTGECSATATVAETTDTCAGTITGTTSDDLTYSTQGTHVITWTFDDKNGNVTTATQNVIVKDNTKPVAPTLEDVTGECSATATVAETTDACTGLITGTTSDDLTYSTQGTHVITWTFDDKNGNVTTATQNVIVKDSTKPVAPTLEDVTGECSATSTVAETTDTCAGVITGTTSDDLTYSTQGTHVITWTFDDKNGNVTTATQNVIVKDITKPVVPALADVTGECSATATVAETTDACTGLITGTTSDDLTYSTQGTHVITWTFDDKNGNVTTATQNVIVKDSTKPVAPTLEDVTGECSATATVAETTDACAGLITGTTSDDLTYSTQGTHVITWTFDDKNGNVTTATQNVIVKDSTPPTITAPNAKIVSAASGLSTTGIVLGTPVTADNCSVVTITNDAPSVFPLGITTVTWTVTDAGGNTATATQSVTVAAAAIVAVSDTVTAINGYVGGTAFSNVLANDTLNGIVINPAEVNVTFTSDNSNITLSNTNDLMVAAGTPAGIYTLTYTVCEKLNPTNCAQETVLVTVTAPAIVAVSDSATINGYIGGMAFGNVLGNDTLNGTAVNASEVTISFVSSSHSNITLLGADVMVAAGTPAGTYTLTYEICEKLNPTNCSSAVVSITVPNFTVTANSYCSNDMAYVTYKVTADHYAPTGLLTINWIDSNNTIVATQKNMPLSGDVLWPGTLVDDKNNPVDWPGWVLANGQWLTGNDGFESTKPAVTMQFILNSTQSLVVNYPDTKVGCNAMPKFGIDIKVNDNVTIADGINGSLKLINVFDNVKINGIPVRPSDLILTIMDIPKGMTLNNDGTIDVAPGTAGGNYTLSYEICETERSYNCRTATSKIFVEVPSISLVQSVALNDTNGNGYAEAGETLTYSFIVKNTGNVDLEDIIITDLLSGMNISGDLISLPVGKSDSYSFVGKYTLSQADINSGSISSQATVSAITKSGIVVDDKSDPSNFDGDNPTVLALSGCAIKVFNAVSPNGDDKNDKFYIQGLECYPDNTVQIFNRWGVLVFERDHYNNNDIAFRGFSEGRATIKNSNGLPPGTYFYIIKYRDSKNNSYQDAGYLYLTN
ncbi:gliding motility-associated C-terminal domain-containing protein [Flavobacterium aquidurense]|uniref:T9SS type B sorting domain-containing protein n=1 Tax=Flavobacterium aquidurense TaxID=362413 RepID=UPI002854B113|nr:gliding motility-associated C-terminal domain-containing protein [Flavobacterium aquidurense]MDR7372886.1 gliding motility-associated-like protein [Flavobacterium aquidurense]